VEAAAVEVVLRRLLVFGVALVLLAARTVVAQPEFTYTELPTLVGGPDVPAAIAAVGSNETYSVGSAQTETVGTSHAVVWECAATTCSLVQLPSAAPSAAADITCDTAGECVAVGWFEAAGGLHQPVAYSRASGVWSAEALPLSAGEQAGDALAVAVDASRRAAACGKKDDTSSCWIRVAQSWSSVPLPDLGAASSALGVGTLPSDGTTFVVAGRAQDTAGRIFPALWQEVAGGSFGTPTILPLPSADDAEATGIETLDADTYLVTGTGLFPSGEVGLLWRVSVSGGDPDLPIIVGNVPNTTSIRMKGKKILENLAAFPGSTDGASGRRGALFLWDLGPTAPAYYDVNDLAALPANVVIESANGIALLGGTGSMVLVAEAVSSPTRAALLLEVAPIPTFASETVALLSLTIVGILLRRRAVRRSRRREPSELRSRRAG